MAIDFSFGPREYDAQKRDIVLPFSGKKYDALGANEVYHSPGEKYAHHAGQATRTFIVDDYANRWDFCAFMLGWSEPRYASDNSFSHLSRVLPDAYKPTVSVTRTQHYARPDVDDWGRPVPGGSTGGINANEHERPWLWANDVVSVCGVGPQLTTILPGLDPGLGTLSTYSKARIEVSYEVRHYRLLIDDELVRDGWSRLDADGKEVPDELYATRYCSFHPQPVALYASVPQDGLVWAADAPVGLAGKPARSESPFVKYSVDCQLRWYGVPDLPAGLNSLLGTVNDKPIEFHPPGQKRYFSAHTLLYIGYRLHTYRQVLGNYVHDIAFLFSYFEPGHNKELAFPPGGKYRYAHLTTGGYDPSSDSYLQKFLYQGGDFSQLFRLSPRGDT